MTRRGYKLLSTELDLHATRDELVRIYEYVRRNIRRIAPFIPDSAELDLLASETPHNTGKIPLLGLFERDNEKGDDSLADQLQDAIDEWILTRDPDKVDQELETINFPTWDHLLKVGTYPQRDHAV